MLFLQVAANPAAIPATSPLPLPPSPSLPVSPTRPQTGVKFPTNWHLKVSNRVLPLWIILWFFSFRSLSLRLRLKNISYILKYTYIVYSIYYTLVFSVLSGNWPAAMSTTTASSPWRELPLPFPLPSSFFAFPHSHSDSHSHSHATQSVSQLVIQSGSFNVQVASCLLSPFGSILTFTRLRRKCHALRLHFDLMRRPHADYNKVP